MVSEDWYQLLFKSEIILAKKHRIKRDVSETLKRFNEGKTVI
jgi:hypothetical protein